MKSDEDVRMISAEAPVLFARVSFCSQLLHQTLETPHHVTYCILHTFPLVHGSKYFPGVQSGDFSSCKERIGYQPAP